MKAKKLNRIKEILKEKGQSQTWLGEMIDKGWRVTTDYVNNNRQPSLEVLYRIAEVLNVDVRDLLMPTTSGDNYDLQEGYMVVDSKEYYAMLGVVSKGFDFAKEIGSLEMELGLSQDLPINRLGGSGQIEIGEGED